MQTYEEYIASLPEGQEPMSEADYNKTLPPKQQEEEKEVKLSAEKLAEYRAKIGDEFEEGETRNIPLIEGFAANLGVEQTSQFGKRFKSKAKDIVFDKETGQYKSTLNENITGGAEVDVKDYYSSEHMLNRAAKNLAHINSEEFTTYDPKDIWKTAGRVHFGIDDLDDFDTKSDTPLTKEQKDEYRSQQASYLKQQKEDNRAAYEELKGDRAYTQIGRDEYETAGVCNPYDPANYTTCLKEKREADPNYQQLQRSLENKKYNTKAEYEEYEKRALGDEYDDYIKYNAALEVGISDDDLKNMSFDEKIIDQAKTQLFNKKLINFNKKLASEAGGAEIQDIMDIMQGGVKSPEEFEKETEVAGSLIEANSLKLKNDFAEIQKEEEPIIKELTTLTKAMNDLGLNDFNAMGELTIDPNWLKDDMSVEEAQTWDKGDYNIKAAQYNDLYKQYEVAYNAYTEAGFEARYNALEKDQEGLKTLINQYNTNVQEYAETGEKDFLIAKALGMDYSLTARTGAALEDFFIGGGYNFINQTGQLGLSAIKALTSNPLKRAQLDKSIASMEQTLTNYNVRLAKERDETIPPAMTLDDIEFGQSGIGVLNYIGEALADNAPSILTTFIPGTLAIRGLGLVSKAAGAYKLARYTTAGKQIHGNVKSVQAATKAYQKALQTQKAYGLYGMRAAQGIFFVGESGGKYGDILVNQHDKKDRLAKINKLLAGKNLSQEQRIALADEKNDLSYSLDNNFSFAQKAFSSYGFGFVATLAETMGSLRLVSGVGKIATNYAKNQVKKELYKNATNFSGVIVKGVIKGLRPAFTKAMPTEVLEEAFTQIGHNAIDITALGEDKSILEGLDADFFVKTAITSFAIMAPTTMSNTRQILQSEFKTEAEILQIEKDVNDLIVIQSQLDQLKGKDRNALNKKKRNLIKKLGFYDALVMNKLNHLSESQIREVADLSRQQRVAGNNMRGLAATGGSLEQNSKEYWDAKKEIQSQYDALETRKNEILGVQQDKIQAKIKNLNTKYGTSVNLDLEYSLGLNDFAMNAALTMSDANKKFTTISAEALNNPTLMEAELKAEGYSEAQIQDVLKKFNGEDASNAMYTADGDIIINEGAIEARMHGLDNAEANYAAIAPLEELFHATIAQKGLKVDGLLKADAASATQELLDLIKGKMETGTAEQQQDLADLLERIELYNDKGTYNYEEMLAQINNAKILGVLNTSDFNSLPSLKSYINGAMRQIMGDASWMTELDSAANVATFMDNWQNNILEDKAVVDQTPPEEEVIVAKPNIKEKEDLESKGKVIPALNKEAKKAEQDLLAIDTRIDATQITPEITFEEFRVQQVKDNQVDRSVFDENRTQAEQAFNDYQSTLVVKETAQESRGKPIEIKDLPENTKTYMELDNSILQQALVSEIQNEGENRFPIAQAIVEKNWPLISKSLNINSQQEMEAAKEIVIDQMLGQFEGSGQGRYGARNTSLLAGFSLDPTAGPAQVSTYLTETVRTRKPEIDAAIADRVGKQGADLKEAITTTVETTETIEKAKVAKKPSETTGLDEVTETKITEAVTESYKGKEVTLAETRNIPKKVANVYADMFGINPQTITDKKRNFQKKDAVGLTKAKQFLLKNAKDDFARLPKTVDASGRGTFIPKNVRDALYTDGKLTGTLKNYLDLIRIKPTKPIYRDRTAQTIRGLLGLHIRNRILETSTTKPKRIQSGAVFSKGKKINPRILEKLSQARDKNEVNTILGVKTEINQDNRKKTQEEVQNNIEQHGLNENTFDAARFSNSGAQRIRLDNGDIVYKLTNGKTIPGILSKKLGAKGQKLFTQPSVAQIEKAHGKNVTLVAARNRLYYGTKDPAYIKAKEAARKNNKKDRKQFKRVFVKNAFTPAGQKQAEINQEVLEEVALQLEKAVANGMPLNIAAIIIEGAYQATTGLIKVAAPFKYRSKKFEYADYGKASDRTGNKYREEHSPPASVIGASLLDAIKNGTVKQLMPSIKDNYSQIQLSKKDDSKIDRAQLDSVLPEGTSILTPKAGALRLAAAGIDLNSIINPKTNKTLAQEIGLTLTPEQAANPSALHYQNELIQSVLKNEGGVEGTLDLKSAKSHLKAAIPVKIAENTQVKFNAETLAPSILSKTQTAFEQKENLLNSMESKGRAIKLNKPKKGISVFDMDDTLAITKEEVLVLMPDNTLRRLSPSQFAEQAVELEEMGATFDFSQFEDVKGAKKGPLADLALKRQDKFGSGDIFVLTARPQVSAIGIKKFLDGIGLNIPLENITGLENGTPQAKADWILNKTAEGYNDFYFADDSLMNVKAVESILDTVDVKGKTQQAMQSKGKKLDAAFNTQIEQVTGKEAFKEYSTARARLEGAKKDAGFLKRMGRQLTITSSAEDFLGLLYPLIGKGKQGDQHMKFFKENLIDLYNKAEQELMSAKVTVANDFAALKKKFPTLRSKALTNPLLQPIGIGVYTKSQAMRVYMWAKQGMDIPGMSKRDINALVKAVEADAELNVFADEVMLINKTGKYPPPTKNWLAGDIKTDIVQGLDENLRPKLMAQFNQNADILFSEKNLNKIEALYGSKHREALEDSLRRMKSGSNRPVYVGGGSRIVNEMLDWLNASVGAVMFVNMRSGLLQLISNVNFINWGDNNIYAAAKAFMSKDYFPTVLKLMNSDYLVNRRDGLKINVNEAELADAGRKGGFKGMLNYLLDKGFIITRIMDSLAIATGGATFFINRKASLQKRVNPETKELYTEAEAEAQAFDDFYAIAEETQQSSNPSKISQQQASLAGRVILSFQNVTMQYTRKTKKSILDLYNRRRKPGMTQRESDLSNISSIIYYTTIQNMIFHSLQQGLFALAFDDEGDEEEKDRAANIANSMADSLLFGLGFGGAIMSTVKNVLMKVATESEKKRPEYQDLIWDIFDVSPVLDSKVRKLRTAAKTFSWNRKEIKERGWSIDNPAYLAIAQLISATTNIPIDRVLRKTMNMRQAMDEEVKTYQRVALFLGWDGWSMGLPYWGLQSTIKKEAEEKEKLNKRYKTKVKFFKSQGYQKARSKKYAPGKLGVDYIQLENPNGIIEYWRIPKNKKKKK